jgi:aryl-alcohol dehydrogenase-like predicted oxidoreductase
MRTTTLGSTGPQVGAIGLGCMGMTSSYDMATPRGVTTSATNSPGAGRNARPEHIRTSIDESLRRLGTDHVDLYHLADLDALPAPEGARY